MQTSDLAARITAEIPVEYQERFASLCAKPARSTADLEAALEAYIDTVRSVAEWVVALDTGLAERIAHTCRALLGRFQTGDHQALISALITYFIEEEDDDEVTGVLAFDDDLQVVNVVCRALDAHDLVLERR